MTTSFKEWLSNKKNTLVVIGITGNKIAYLNVPIDEAIKRYLNEHDSPADIKLYDQLRKNAEIFDFVDEFGVYEAWKTK